MTAPQLWPIFICYRRVDGGTAARRLYEMLDKWQTTGPENQPVQVDAYLDETMPGIADWKAMHRPYLEKARALVVVCARPAPKSMTGPRIGSTWRSTGGWPTGVRRRFSWTP